MVEGKVTTLMHILRFALVEMGPSFELGHCYFWIPNTDKYYIHGLVELVHLLYILYIGPLVTCILCFYPIPEALFYFTNIIPAWISPMLVFFLQVSWICIPNSYTLSCYILPDSNTITLVMLGRSSAGLSALGLHYFVLVLSIGLIIHASHLFYRFYR